MRTVTTRVITGRVNADGTPAVGGAFSSRKTATGIYTITFGGERLVGISLNCLSGGGGFVILPVGISTYSATVSVGTSAGANVDGSFTFTATVAA
jgi:hypothetical protein